MNITTALILGLEVGILVFCAAVEIGWRRADRKGWAASRRALRETAGDGFYMQFLAYRLGHRVDVPLRFERPAYTSSRTWGDA
ncbi:hypothetical protein ACH4RG_14465 [Streptomyces sp. NPDC021019]|uniref:hypothetical protein n=1 Tax=Streptomyces sp. NPDC021019 TaxID=3365108 RepID=UPI00378E4F34